jgi:chromosome segregation ATPase
MERTTELSSAEEGVSKVLERGRLLQEEASSLTTRWTRDADVLSQQAVALLSDITSLKADINNASEKDDITQPVAQKLEEELYKLQKMMYDGDTASLLPSKANGRTEYSNHSLILQLLSICNNWLIVSDECKLDEL